MINQNCLVKTAYENIGFIGIGKYNSGKKYRNCFLIWRSIIQRCYSTDIKYHTYIGCVVDEKWHNFQNFAEWYYNNHIDSFQLAKNILIKNNKIYSEDTCCFVPQQIILLFNNSKNKNRECPVGIQKTKKNKAEYRHQRYVVNVSNCNKNINLGYFDTVDEAFKTYKLYKEKHIKWVALTWKDKISEKVYNVLINYVVEIND